MTEVLEMALSEAQASERFEGLLRELFDRGEFVQWYQSQTEHYKNVFADTIESLVRDPLLRKQSLEHRKARLKMLRDSDLEMLFEYLKTRARNKRWSGNEPDLKKLQGQVGNEGRSERKYKDNKQGRVDKKDEWLNEWMYPSDLQVLHMCVDGKIGSFAPGLKKQKVAKGVHDVLRDLKNVDSIVTESSGRLNETQILARLKDMLKDDEDAPGKGAVKTALGTVLNFFKECQGEKMKGDGSYFSDSLGEVAGAQNVLEAILERASEGGGGDDADWPTLAEMEGFMKARALLAAVENEPVRLTLFGDEAGASELDGLLGGIFTIAAAADAGELVPFRHTSEDLDEWQHFHVSVAGDQLVVEYLLPAGYELASTTATLELVSHTDERLRDVEAVSDGDYVVLKVGDMRFLRRWFQQSCREMNVVHASDVTVFAAVQLARIQE